MKRYSRKREAILDCLRSTTTHPTADWVYNKLKPVCTDLSLATVYRNLNDLQKNGVIISVGTVAGQEHFDANMTPHFHAVCTVCGEIVDIMDLHVPHEFIEDIKRLTGYTVSEESLRFSGVCRECLMKNQNYNIKKEKTT